MSLPARLGVCPAGHGDVPSVRAYDWDGSEGTGRCPLCGAELVAYGRLDRDRSEALVAYRHRGCGGAIFVALEEDLGVDRPVLHCRNGHSYISVRELEAVAAEALRSDPAVNPQEAHDG